MLKSPKISAPKPKEKGKETNVSRIPLLILLQLSRSILEKSKFFKINQSTLSSNDKKSSYIQASKRDINSIIKIKYVFPKLLANKVLENSRDHKQISKKKKQKSI